jgi:glutathione S-transferase
LWWLPRPVARLLPDLGLDEGTPARTGTPKVYLSSDQEVVMSDSGDTHLKRFVVLVKSNAQVEAGTLPTEQDLSAMSRFNDELIESGAMLAGEGFLASAGGARLSYADGGVRVQSGPFEDPESLVAGYWIIQAGSLNEAIDLMKRAPMGGGTVEIRQIADAEDFGKAYTSELRDREERQRSKMEGNARRRAA